MSKPAGFLSSPIFAVLLVRRPQRARASARDATRHLTLPGNPPARCPLTLRGNLWLQGRRGIDLSMTRALAGFPLGWNCVLCVSLRERLGVSPCPAGPLLDYTLGARE